MAVLAPRDSGFHPFAGAVHILVLWNLAVAHPLLDVLANSPQFFIAHRSGPTEILLVVALICFLVPGALIALAGTTRIISRDLWRAPYAVGIATLATALVLLSAKRLLDPSAPALLGLAVAGGGLLATGYFRLPLLRTFVTCLVPGLFLIPGAFVWGSDISKLVFPRGSHPASVDLPQTDVPVALIVFDELPLASLLDPDWQIDAAAYPNFARLARDAHWFRNATTVAHNTFYGIPAIVAGRAPAPGRLPFAADYPDTVFTLLEGSHELHVVEAGTALCPEALCAGDGAAPTYARMAATGSDLLVIYLHVLLPSSMTAMLPPLNMRWSHFRSDSAGRVATQARPTLDDIHKGFLESISSDRTGVFVSFVERVSRTERPGFHFLHTTITHSPWVHLPSGRVHAGGHQAIEGLLDDVWSTDEFLVANSYRRHLLQIGFADRLLGRLLERLISVDLYDEMLLIVTSDHGSSFRPGDRHRQLTPTNLAAILPVPLFIKLPNQQRGQTNDEPVETVDILPTIADVLRIQVPFAFEGRSVFQRSGRRERAAFGDDRHFIVPESELPLATGPLARKLSLLGFSGRWDGFRTGPAFDVVDRAVSEFPVGQAGDLTVTLDNELALRRVDPDSHFLPVQVRGRIAGRASFPAGADLAIAVNGVIRATTRAFLREGHLRFAAFLPEQALEPGDNLVQVLIVSQKEKTPGLLAIAPARDYRLVTADDGQTFVDDGRRRLAVVPDSLLGYVDAWEQVGERAWASGWAAEGNLRRPAEVVVVFVDGQFAGAGVPMVARPDVARHFAAEALHLSGFSVDVLPPSGANLESSRIRFFALSRSGAAAELTPVPEALIGGRSSDDGH